MCSHKKNNVPSGFGRGGRRTADSDTRNFYCGSNDSIDTGTTCSCCAYTVYPAPASSLELM
eukprot:1523225-Rhodomonas_salina.2